MPDTLPNIELKAGVWTDLYAKSKIPVGTEISIYGVSDSVVRVHFGNRPDDDSGYRAVLHRGDEVFGGLGSSGAWGYSNSDAEVNIEVAQSPNADPASANYTGTPIGIAREFPTEQDRDTFFTNNPGNKVNGVFAIVNTVPGKSGAQLQRWNGAGWVSMATFIKGDKGDAGVTPHIGGNGNWYIGNQDTGVQAERVLDLTGLHDGEIPKFDADTGQLVASGVKSDTHGDIEMAPDSLMFGQHKMSSSPADVFFTNTFKNKVFSPVWQEVKPGNDEAYFRVTEAAEEVTRVPASASSVVNPSNDVTIDADELFFGGEFELSSPATNLRIEMYRLPDLKLVWQSEQGDLSKGKHQVMFKTPFRVEAGYKYRITLKSDSGDVYAKGAGGNFSWRILRSKYKNVLVASRDWVTAAIKQAAPAVVDTSKSIVSVSLNGAQLTFTHGDGAKHVITLPNGGADVSGLRASVTALQRSLTQQGTDLNTLKNQYGQLDHELSALGGTYSYDGSSLPTYPNDPKHSYFVHIHGSSSSDINMELPQPSGGSIADGAMFVLGNAARGNVVLRSGNLSTTIEGHPKYTLAPNHFIMLVKSGNNWIKVVDSSLFTQQVPIHIDPDDVANALDRGQFTGRGSIKTLDFGWWVIPASNKQVTGRPPGSQGDISIYKAKVGAPDQGGRPQYGVIMAFGQDKDGNSQAWVEYRTTAGWTPWVSLSDAASGAAPDLTTVKQEIADLKTGQQAFTTKLDNLETELGKVFAPDKSAFDTEVNKLIKAAITPLQTAITQLEAAQKAMPATVESALTAKGWGPISGGHSGGGGDHHQVVLPQIVAMFGDNGQMPSKTTGTGTFTSTSGKVTISRSKTDRERIFVFVENENDEAHKVTGISVNSGMAAVWGHQDRTLDGKKWRMFYSAGAYTETSAAVKVNFE